MSAPPQVPGQQELTGRGADLPELPDPHHRPLRSPPTVGPPLLSALHPAELLLLPPLGQVQAGHQVQQAGSRDVQPPGGPQHCPSQVGSYCY